MTPYSDNFFLIIKTKITIRLEEVEFEFGISTFYIATLTTVPSGSTRRRGVDSNRAKKSRVLLFECGVQYYSTYGVICPMTSYPHGIISHGINPLPMAS